MKERRRKRGREIFGNECYKKGNKKKRNKIGNQSKIKQK